MYPSRMYRPLNNCMPRPNEVSYSRWYCLHIIIFFTIPPGLCSALSDIRTGPTDERAPSRGHMHSNKERYCESIMVLLVLVDVLPESPDA